MLIHHTHTDRGGRFYLDEPADSTTELVYKMQGPHKMIIEHTEVSNKHEGKGIGKLLVSSAVDFARSQHIKILPLCTFAHSVIARTSEFQDVLAQS